MQPVRLFDHDENRRSIAAGQTLFAEGEPRDFLYAVVAGEVEIRIDGEVVEVAGSGSLVGELALIDEGPRSTSVVALTDVVVVPIDRERFLFLVQQTPFFALEVMQILAERLRRMNRRFADRGASPAVA